MAETIPLQTLDGRRSTDTTGSSDLDRLLSQADSNTSASTVDRDLPPVDGGRRAWTCLLGCWLVEAMAWGFPLSFGVFQRYYSAHPLFHGPGSAWIPTIGTLATGVAYLGMPLMNHIVLRWPRHRRRICLAGWLLILVGLVGASLASQVWQLLLFQGFLYGAGWVVCYTPFLFILNEWFVEKRGLAYGILFGASGVSGLVVPIAENWMLEKYGFRTALAVYALATIVIGGPGLFLIKPRAHTATDVIPGGEQTVVKGLKAFRSYVNNVHFNLLAATVFVQGLGFFVPNIYLPSYAEDLGLPHSTGSGILALVSLSQVLGQLWQGWISDRVNVYIPVFLSAVVPGLAAVLLWGPAKGLSQLAPFALIWGFFSASYSVLYTRMCTFLTVKNDQVDEDAFMLLYGFISFERGVANVLEGPISSWLLSGDFDSVNVGKFALKKYSMVVWFTVLTMLISSVAGVGWFWVPRNNKPSVEFDAP